MKYKEWLNEWLLSCVKLTTKIRTYQKYTEIVRIHISPNLGHYQLDDLNVSILQSFVADLSSRYAANTVTIIVVVIKSSLDRAYQTGRMAKQFSGMLQCPKVREKKVECFSESEQKKIEQYIFSQNDPKHCGILLCLYTGLRIGELLALEWKDIDLVKNFISVTKSCSDQWANGIYKKLIDTPKTETSERIIPIPKQLLPYLKAVRKQSSNAYIVERRGKVISVRSYQRTFELMQKKLNIPHKGFHALRHTFATRALECGMDIKTLSEILGHKNPTITLKRYAHSLMEHKCAMMNRLGKNLDCWGKD